MYVPEKFKFVDEPKIYAFLERYDFATIITSTPQGLISTHSPVLARRERAEWTIVGHVARENPHWEAMNDESTESLAIFHGPHAYVSPTWYENSPAVPTWNYAVVHAYGPLRASQDRTFINGVLADLVQRHEAERAHPWRMEDLPSAFHESLVSRIVGFEMRVRRLEAKFKLGQNRSLQDQEGTIKGLDRELFPEAAALAEFMRTHLKGR